MSSSRSACAVWGGATSATRDSVAEVFREAAESPTAVPGAPVVIPADPELPRLTKVFPSRRSSHAGLLPPGCPPSGDAVFAVLDDLANGRPVALPTRLTKYD